MKPYLTNTQRKYKRYKKYTAHFFRKFNGCFWKQLLIFKSYLQTNVGPILLCVNPYRDVGNPLTLSSTRGLALSAQLNRVVQEAVRQQSETGYPQAIILSGKLI